MGYRNGRVSATEEAFYFGQRFRPDAELQRLRIRSWRVAGHFHERIRAQSYGDGADQPGAAGWRACIFVVTRSGIPQGAARAFVRGGQTSPVEAQYCSAV